eukprot:5087727-Alexandrium_andersonii.AAC.1
MTSTCLQQLQRYLTRTVVAIGEDGDDAALSVGASLGRAFREPERLQLTNESKGIQGRLAQMLFFSLVRLNPQAIVRPQTHGDVWFAGGDVGVAVHEFMSANTLTRE